MYSSVIPRKTRKTRAFRKAEENRLLAMGERCNSILKRAIVRQFVCFVATANQRDRLAVLTSTGPCPKKPRNALVEQVCKAYKEIAILPKTESKVVHLTFSSTGNFKGLTEFSPH